MPESGRHIDSLFNLLFFNHHAYVIRQLFLTKESVINFLSFFFENNLSEHFDDETEVYLNSLMHFRWFYNGYPNTAEFYEIFIDIITN
jgi:hypothetical protein